MFGRPFSHSLPVVVIINDKNIDVVFIVDFIFVVVVIIVVIVIVVAVVVVIVTQLCCFALSDFVVWYNVKTVCPLVMLLL